MVGWCQTVQVYQPRKDSMCALLRLGSGHITACLQVESAGAAELEVAGQEGAVLSSMTLRTLNSCVLSKATPSRSQLLLWTMQLKRQTFGIPMPELHTAPKVKLHLQEECSLSASKAA